MSLSCIFQYHRPTHTEACGKIGLLFSMGVHTPADVVPWFQWVEVGRGTAVDNSCLLHFWTVLRSVTDGGTSVIFGERGERCSRESIIWTSASIWAEKLLSVANLLITSKMTPIWPRYIEGKQCQKASSSAYNIPGMGKLFDTRRNIVFFLGGAVGVWVHTILK